MAPVCGSSAHRTGIWRAPCRGMRPGPWPSVCDFGLTPDSRALTPPGAGFAPKSDQPLGRPHLRRRMLHILPGCQLWPPQPLAGIARAMALLVGKRP